MSGCRPSASPTVSPGPVTTLRTPSGIPASAPSSAIRSRLSDVVEAGLMTIVLPVASAGPELPGRHLGRVVPRDDAPPTTPTGSRVIVATAPSGDGATWP